MYKLENFFRHLQNKIKSKCLNIIVNIFLRCFNYGYFTEFDFKVGLKVIVRPPWCIFFLIIIKKFG